MNERKLIYIALGICSALGAMVPGSEVLAPFIGEAAVQVIQWAAGGIIGVVSGALIAWRAYIDQHESRNPKPTNPNETPVPNP
jgi:4-amino-4-deoxy-L-arabinose transferase-like glycosyltransferase